MRRWFSTSKKGGVNVIVNGKKHVIEGLEPNLTLIDYLRRSLGLTGTKLACGEGGCGACTVLVTRRLASGALDHRALNSCLVPVYAVADAEVTTVEGLGTSTAPHPIQQAVVDAFGSQCGYCTPGFVMSLASEMQRNPAASLAELEKCTDGNLCRCTGYRSIAAAIERLPASARAPLPISLPLDSSSRSEIHIRGKDFEWRAPTSLDALLSIKQAHPEAKLVQGASEVALEQRFGKRDYSQLVCTDGVEELRGISVEPDGLRIGAGLPLSDLSRHLLAIRPSLRPGAQRLVDAILQQLRWFSGTSVRNGAGLAGNIATASPISDLNPLWVVSDAVFALHNASSAPRHIPASSFFLPKYRSTALLPTEVIVSLFVPFPSDDTYIHAYKTSRRREDDIALVNCALRLRLDSNNNRIMQARASFGGVAAYLRDAPAWSRALEGRPLSRETADLAEAALAADVFIEKNAPGGMSTFRAAAARGMARRFLLRIAASIPRNAKAVSSGNVDFSPAELADALALNEEDAGALHGTQTYGPPGAGQVGRAVPHASSMRQVTGEALYTDDLPVLAREGAAAAIVSPYAFARILSIDASRALEMEGVTGVYTYRDVPGNNKWGDIVHDEEVLASEVVTCVGQPVAVLVADSPEIAARAARLVRVQYEDWSAKAVLNIPDAIEKKSFLPGEHELRRGDVDAALGASEGAVSGVCVNGGQEHFYFEPNVTLAVPGDGEMTLYASTQNCNKTQLIVAEALGLPAARVSCTVRRIGGGFGGKETRTIHWSLLAAVAAHHERRPVRLLLARDQDMMWTGGRHPFRAEYTAGYAHDAAGAKVTALDLRLFADAGCNHDLSWPVMDRALMHSDNAYYVAAHRAAGRLCLTHKPSNTAYRGFGGPQGMLACEAAFEHVARAAGADVHALRRRHLYTADQTTPFGQPLENTQLRALWDACEREFGYAERADAARAFNRTHAYRARGVAMIPSKFGIAFTFPTLNQAGALVSVFTDGSVLVSHGGVEMGQGLHTKCLQVAADALGVPLSRVYISDTSTSKIANASATAASMGTDLYCQAVADACAQIDERLKPYRAKLKGNDMAALAHAAYLDRVSLQAHAFFAPREVRGFDFATQTGRPFRYFTSGVAAAEVEVDTLSGDHRVRRADVVMDVGKAINPMIDIGQIEGAFAQGQGWLTVEELVWGGPDAPWVAPGVLKTNGPGNYKIPSMDDMARSFNVHLMPNIENPIAIHSSRAIGEPPFFLGSSVMFAIRDAAYSKTRKYHPVQAPLTIERILNMFHE